MGEMADWFLEALFDPDEEPELPTKRSKWITRDGREFTRKEMTTEHINNVISYLSKYDSDFSDEWIRLMKSELRRRSNAKSRRER